jgi:hypothetical protein
LQRTRLFLLRSTQRTLPTPHMRTMRDRLPCSKERSSACEYGLSSQSFGLYSPSPRFLDQKAKQTVAKQLYPSSIDHRAGLPTLRQQNMGFRLVFDTFGQLLAWWPQGASVEPIWRVSEDPATEDRRAMHCSVFRRTDFHEGAPKFPPKRSLVRRSNRSIPCKAMDIPEHLWDCQIRRRTLSWSSAGCE